MRWGQILLSAWRCLQQRRLRSFLSTLGIVFAVVAVVSMLAIAEGARRQTMEQIAQLGTRNIIIRQAKLTDEQKRSASERLSRGLELADEQRLRRGLAAAGQVAPLREVRAAVAGATEETSIEVLAVTGAYQPTMSLDVGTGRFLSESDVRRRNLVCVVGAEIGALLKRGLQPGQTLHLEQRSYRVVGVLQARDHTAAQGSALSVRNYNRSILIPLGAEPAAVGSSLSEIIVQVHDEALVPAAALAARRVLRRNHGGVEDFQLVVPQELLEQAARTQRIFTLVLASIAAISLLVGGIGIMNVMLASVSERTREIGIRRSVGASRLHIVAQFLAESVMLTVAGGGVGVFLGVVAAMAI
ncbi:MAG: ABC transporter permease, partial [Phycisphaerae bacterium]|nr:ABC transporter permease [Phycisphaerae bacterium]